MPGAEVDPRGGEAGGVLCKGVGVRGKGCGVRGEGLRFGASN
jgi:hypothetical protein